MKVREVYDIINSFAPYATQEEYDNSGLNVGDWEAEVTGILTCVDVSLETIKEAVSENCNLIVSHHPINFRPVVNLVTSDYVSSVVMEAVKAGVNLLSGHTNVDKADGGINDRLAEKLGGYFVKKIPEVDEYARFFKVDTVELSTFVDEISNGIQDDNISSIGQGEVSKVAVVGGAGGDLALIDYCINNDVVLVTSELKHHLARMIEDRGGKIIIIGHFTGERVFIDVIKDLFKIRNVIVKESKQLTPFNSIYRKE